MNDTQVPVAIRVNDISKAIRGKPVLTNVSLVVPAGHIYGITGHNGAGKSMLLRTICGLVRPDCGNVFVFEKRIGGKNAELPDQIGILIDGPGFLPNYSGWQNLRFLARIRNKIDEIEIADAIQTVGLDPADTKPVRAYSTGMRQRLGIAQAIMEQPKLLLLDEPTSSIDREGVKHLHTLFRVLNEAGVTILITSHNLIELEALCHSVYTMEAGTLLNDR